MTHTTTGDPAVTDATFLARHAAARVWRHLSDDPDTPTKTRAALLEYLPAIEADPVGADWERAYSVAWEDDTTIYDVAARRAASSAAAAAYDTAGVAYDFAAANATRAVRLGCAGSDRIGLALTLLADAGAEAVDLPDVTNAWELAGMVIEDGH